VAGPDLEHADAEVAAIKARYPAARALYGTGATIAATLAGMDGASMVHLAAHGSHDPENALFSRLHLADGPLMAYDLQQLDTAPDHVVLSACDLGRAVVRPGDEILGFTAALLYAGTATVIASVARVPDEAAAELMARYHRALTEGTEPARALAATSYPAPFVCFGAG
jgi:CHAT domain-containing protein